MHLHNWEYYTVTFRGNTVEARRCECSGVERLTGFGAWVPFDWEGDLE